MQTKQSDTFGPSVFGLFFKKTLDPKVIKKNKLYIYLNTVKGSQK